jgi:hypothetical protein
MRTEAGPARFEWPAWRRRLVSLGILIHGAAVVVAILAGGMRRSAPPMIFSAAYFAAGPYLRTLNLDNPYRFFAPDPGATVTLWLRVERKDPAGREYAEWREHPDRGDSRFRQSYERGLVRAARLLGHLGPDAKDPQQLTLGPLGAESLAAIVRALLKDASGIVCGIEVYLVQRRLPSPDECAGGMELYDLRLHRTCRLAKFDADGRPDEKVRPAAIASSALAGQALADLEDPRSERTRLPKALAWAARKLAEEGGNRTPTEYRRAIETLAEKELGSWK